MIEQSKLKAIKTKALTLESIDSDQERKTRYRDIQEEIKSLLQVESLEGLQEAASSTRGMEPIEGKKTTMVSHLLPKKLKFQEVDYEKELSGLKHKETQDLVRTLSTVGLQAQPHQIIGKRIRFLLWFFVPLTGIISFLGGKTYFDQYVPHVQTWYKPLNQWTHFFFRSEEVLPWVYAFFGVDFLWGPLFALLLYLIYVWFVKWHNRPEPIRREKKEIQDYLFFLSPRYLPLMSWGMILAASTDLIEGIFTLRALPDYALSRIPFSLKALQVVVPLKTLAYGIGMLLVVIQALYYLFSRKDTLNQIQRYFQQNTTTLIVIAIMVFLVTRLGQGGALVESLLERPFQYILILILLLNLLTLMSWQWPYYHNLFRAPTTSKGDTSEQVSFHIQSYRSALIGNENNQPKTSLKNVFQAFFSIISLQNPEDKIPKKRLATQKVTWYDIQRIQAILLFVIAIFIFLDRWAVSTDLPALRLGALLALVLIIYTYFFVKRRFEIQVYLEDCEGESLAPFWNLFRLIARISIFIMVLSFGILVWTRLQEGNSVVKLSALSAFMLGNAILYIPLTISRSKLKEASRHKLFNFAFGKDARFMAVLSLLGYVALALILALNWWYRFNAWMHPINIALIYLILLFSALNFFVKGTQVVFTQLNGISLGTPRIRSQYYFLVGSLILLLGFLYYAGSIGGENHFHELEQIPVNGISYSASGEKTPYTTKTPDSTDLVGIPFPSYFQSRWELAPKDSTGVLQEPFIMISSDGGGLRACYWTLLILHKLDMEMNGALFRRTLAMSGASGGMVGLGIYLAIKNHYPGDFDAQRAAIDRIGNANFISNDFTYLLGKNVAKNFIPRNIRWMDDGSETMSLHYMNQLLKRKSGNSIKSAIKSMQIPELAEGYRSVWNANYHKHGKLYPLLLTNSTQSESVIKGIASPLQNESHIFKAAISMLDFPLNPGHSISFMDALFSCNRFPIFSQAAEIHTKGHFIDAGGFDNSGISSLIDILDFLQLRYPDLYANYHNNILFISIHNDGTTFVRNHFEEFREYVNRTDPKGEFSPLINVGASRGISGEPFFLDERLQQLDNTGTLLDYIEFDLPFPLDRDNVQLRYNGQIENEKNLSQIIERLNSQTGQALVKGGVISNPNLDLHPYIVEPPLGRILSTPVVRYTQAMLQHQEVIGAFERITERFPAP